MKQIWAQWSARFAKVMESAAALLKALHDDGGFTLKERLGDGPKTGFMVSLPDFEKTHPIAKLDRDPQPLLDYAQQNEAEIEAPDQFYGGWLHPTKKIVYLDVSHHFDKSDHEAAVRAAHDWHQISYYDIDTGDAIDPDTGEVMDSDD